MIYVLATFVIGVLIGYLGQRSRFCIISAIRDYYLIRDSYRIKGVFSALLGALAGFVVFSAFGGSLPSFPVLAESLTVEPKSLLLIIAIGGLGMAFFSVFVEGCPFRQHVMAAEGVRSARFYLMGLYIGIVYFYLVVVKYVSVFVRILG